MLVTSRPEQDIQIDFNKWAYATEIVTFQRSHVLDDIDTYVKARMRKCTDGKAGMTFEKRWRLF